MEHPRALALAAAAVLGLSFFSACAPKEKTKVTVASVPPIESLKKPTVVPPEVPKGSWDSLEIYIAGKVYKLPTSTDAFSDDWTLDGSLSNPPQEGYVPGQYTFPSFFISNKKEIVTLNATLGNFTEQMQQPLQMTIVSIDSMPYQGGALGNEKVFLPSGIHLGSTQEEVVKAYGKPAAEEITKEGITIWGYKREDESTLVINLNPEKKVSFFEILYAPISPYRKKLYDGTNALAPKGEWNSRQFSMDGILFTMPYAYSDLEKLGWIPRKDQDKTDLEKILAPGVAAAELVQLKHHFYDYTLLLGFVNKTGVSAPAKNTQILYFSTSYNAMEKKKPLPFLMLPKGITWGSTIEEVEAAYGKPSQKTEEGSTVGLVYEDEKNWCWI